MKNLKKIIIMLSMVVLTTGLILTGCGKKIDPPEVTAEAFYNLYILGDSSKIEKLGVEKSEYESALEIERTSMKNATRSNFIKGGLTISEDQLDKIADAEMGALKKLSVKIETSSTSDDEATVKLATTYVDIIAADTKAGNDALEEVKAMGLTSQTELKEKFVEIYSNKIIENINAVEPSTDTKEKTFTFKKQAFNVDGKAKDLWVPNDMTAFGTDLGKMVTGQIA